MRILGLDTSSDACSVAIFDTGSSQVLAEERVLLQRGHAELIFAQIARAAAAADLALDMVDCFAVTTGPGTFTGVRIGLAAARGLALAAAKPLIGVGSLEVMAAEVEAPNEHAIVAAIDARRGEIYVQAFLAGRAVTEPLFATIEAAADALLAAAPEARGIHAIGTGAAKIAEALAARGAQARPMQTDPFPKARVLARLAANRPLSAERPAPLYLRKPDATPSPGPSWRVQP